MMLIYDREASGNSYKVRLLLAFLGLPYARKAVALGANAKNAVDAEYLRINPRGQIPTLCDGDQVLWGSTAILCYLAASRDPSGQWLPLGDPLRLGQVMQWMELAQNEFVTGLFRARAIKRFGYPGDLQQAHKDAAIALGVLENRLGSSRWLADGDNPTIADIACFPYTALASEGDVSLEGYPHIRNWIERLKAWPGFIPLPA